VIEAIAKLVRGEHLTEREASDAMATIMRGDATPSQIAGLLVGLRIRGESVDEIAGMARTAREFAARPPVDSDGLLDVVGTGGDALGTFNISTLSAVVAAACGARVAKHGNRAASSPCGSADVLEALGVVIDLAPEAAARCLEEAGICFLFAPVYHPSFRYAGVPRRELGVRTVFNILGPLCNPAGARRQALGVADAALARRMAEVLVRLGVEHVLVFHGEDGMDELTITGPSQVIEVRDGALEEYVVDPRELGFAQAPLEAMRGGGPADNAAIAREVLAGAEGPRRDIVLLNSAAALKAAGLAKDFREGIGLAVHAIDSGAAADKLDAWIAASERASAIPA
jgi:anthranilate phosphoribosyltransferase